MSKRSSCWCGKLRWVLLGCLIVIQAGWLNAQDNRIKKPEWKHGMDLRVRKAGVADFKDAQKFGVEVFLDPNTNKLVYISETGSMAVVPAPATFPDKTREPEWQHAMELRVRKANEEDFTKDTKKFGLEVFRDENNGNLIYLCETGAISVVPGAANVTRDKDPTWQHAMKLGARKASEAEFTKDTRKYGVEVFRDENTGHLVYISEVGALAIVSASAQGGKPRDPVWKHAMTLKVRKGGDPDFNDKTPRYGVEVYLDPNTNKLVYIAETGALSVPGAVQVIEPKIKSPDWKHGIDLKSRKAGELDWDKARTYGLEVYLDENTGSLVYISETASICDLPK